VGESGAKNSKRIVWGTAPSATPMSVGTHVQSGALPNNSLLTTQRPHRRGGEAARPARGPGRRLGEQALDGVGAGPTGWAQGLALVPARLAIMGGRVIIVSAHLHRHVLNHSYNPTAL
jgi:hypothetical protein